MLFTSSRWIIALFTFIGSLASFSSFAESVAFRPNVANFQISLDSKESSSLNRDEINSVSRFLLEISSILPEKMKSTLVSGVQIRFADIESDWVNRCEWNQIMGYRLGASRGNVITLERTLKQAILDGPARASKKGCGYPNAYRFAMATLIHEIARVYDRQSELSKNPRIQTLLGAAEIGGILPKRRQGEEISERTPDVSEFENSEEGFAVNIERYAMDPEYACRRPALAHAFASLLSWNPYPSKPCEINSVVPLSQEEVSHDAVRFVHLDPKRLYQVHYLFASRGKETMSRWGHAMYRLVFCAPERETPGPDCLKDISYHVVVSFRANVQGYEISPLKGLNGDYPSRLYLLSLLEVMREYNSDELRDLISLPLNLSQDQAQEFLYRSLQMFWEYRGRYQFLSNNCATEALNLLKSVIDDIDFQKVHVVTPVGLYDSLAQRGLVDEKLVGDRKWAKEQGYVFPSERSRLEKAIQEIGRHDPASDQKSLDPYLDHLSASERMSWFKALANAAPKSEQAVLASQFFILESYLVRKQETAFFRQVVELLEDDDSRSQLDREGRLMSAVLRAKELEESLSPQRLAPKGYGIALPSDFPPDLEQKIAQTRTELIKIMDTLRQSLQEQFPDRYQELLRTVENRRAFARALKE
jgi:hypothetical protein